MSDRRWGSILSLVRQGFSLEREFGARTIEELVSLAELVEESVYARGSLEGSTGGLNFRLLNPPLRTGAFASLRIVLDGIPIAEERIRVRSGDGAAWRTATEIDRDRPLEMRPGQPTEVRIDGARPSPGSEVHLRLELQSIAIPPLVWLEITDVVRGVAGP
ncbi:MAG: hypothetical protein ACREB9_02085 [Thermoplasmata archaeon]